MPVLGEPALDVDQHVCYPGLQAQVGTFYDTSMHTRKQSQLGNGKALNAWLGEDLIMFARVLHGTDDCACKGN